ncbi:MAG: flagellar M-ring protein FliF [Gammaproteobacteria bacterium]|nr:flagellar M-ring protein FliF [Gammaproteobacteria bacterium]
MDSTAVVPASPPPMSNLSLSAVLRIPAVRQVTLLLGLTVSVAAGFAITLWSQSPGYTRLYGDLAGADAAQVTEALRSADIPYKLNESSGDVMVPDARLHDARLELASQGLPQGAAAGFEMLQDQSSFGVSQFMENARYQHALESELAKTIRHMGAVRDARVHLAIPKQSSFVRDKKTASASVLLQLFRGRELEPDQTSSIVHLVASSVPNLTVNSVTLIDQHGRLLSSASNEWQDTQTTNQFKLAQRLEENYQRRIEELLTPLVGPGRVRAQVNADLDFTVTEETRESFDPARTVVRSEQISEDERRSNSGAAQGVPGALSNQPPQAGGNAAADAQADDAGSQPVNSTRSSMRNFEVDRMITHTRPQTGNIRRLSVAVLVDDSPVQGADAAADDATDAQGDAADASNAASLTDEDIARFTSLVREAVGIDESRGDTVVVVNAAFRSMPAIEPAEEPKIWEKPVLRDAMKQVLGVALVLALAFGLVRPTLRNLIASHAEAPAQAYGEMAAGGAAAAQLPGGTMAIAAPTYDEKVAAAKNITGSDPARVAQVVRQWVSTDE